MTRPIPVATAPEDIGDEAPMGREPLRSLIAPLAASFGAAAAILRAQTASPKGGHLSLDIALGKGGPLDPGVADAWPDGAKPAAPSLDD